MIEGQLEIQMTASALDEEDTSQKQTLDPLNHGSRDEQKSKKSDAKASKGLRRSTQKKSPRQKIVAATNSERKPFLMVLQSHTNNRTIG